MEDIHVALPEQVAKEGTVYTLNAQLWVRDKNVLEIHGAGRASSDAVDVSLLRLKVREGFVFAVPHEL